MQSRAEAILSSLFGVAVHYDKKYCYPSQGKLLQLLRDYHGVDISRRTLNRDLLDLVSDGYIKRLRRIRRIPSGSIQFTSTLYKFTAKAFIWLNSLARWTKKLFSTFRVPKMAHNKSSRGNEICSGSSAACGNPVESRHKGGLHPFSSDG